MDDSELPAGQPQIEPQDGGPPGGGVGSVGSHLPSASDENENQLDGCGQHGLTGSAGAMGRPAEAEQDTLNNNAGCTPPWEAATGEASEHAVWGGPGGGQDLSGKDTTAPGNGSSRATGPARTAPAGLSSGDAAPVTQEDVLSASTRADGGEESAKGHAHNQPEAPTPALQSLFSLIRGEVEQLDSRALPLCLHQIAESYFQEEDYEKAMKFIQLERLYHEQLLANLSAIQEQWETKWKTVQPRAVTSPRNSERGFNGEDFERLTKFCATHQDPLPSAYKKAAAEPALRRQRVATSVEPGGPPGSGAAAPAPERGAGPGMEPRAESPRRADPPTPGSGTAAAAGPERPAPELPARPAGRLSAQSAREDREDREDGGRPQPAPPEARGAAAQAEGPSEDPEAPPASRAATAPPVSAGSEPTPPAPGSAGSQLTPPAPGAHPAGSEPTPPALGTPSELTPPAPAAPSEPSPPAPASAGSQPAPPAPASAGSELTSPAPVTPPAPGAPPVPAPRKELQLPLADAPGAAPTDPPAPPDLEEPPQPEPAGSDGGPGGSGLSAEPPEGCAAPARQGGPDPRVSREAEDYLNSLLQGCLLEGDLPDLSPDLSPDEASYSLQDDPPSDGSLSPDDLAPRIQIAEVVPAAGLVSILKKRNDAVGGPAQMQQKPAKRRVRFQEIDDNLDQDEPGSGSCLLLVLLCIATVLLSVGGTALYCAFGDLASPVCTDFALNVDFYYTKLLRGVAGLKHWVYLS